MREEWLVYEYSTNIRFIPPRPEELGNLPGRELARTMTFRALANPEAVFKSELQDPEAVERVDDLKPAEGRIRKPAGLAGRRLGRLACANLNLAVCRTTLAGNFCVRTPLCGMLISRVDSIVCGKNSCTISRVSSINKIADGLATPLAGLVLEG